MKHMTCLKQKSDHGKLVVPCLIKDNEYPSALYDIGSSVSIMPKTMAEELNLKVEPSNDSFTLVECSKVNLRGIVNNVPLQINNTLVPVDFHVMDIQIDWNSSLLLGKAFRATNLWPHASAIRTSMKSLKMEHQSTPNLAHRSLHLLFRNQPMPTLRY
ncbi:hypothetical protein N665_0024s0039 [Sinapis alba]|nr:hypothetical protein N665_0024s0039 [Sinapis alba]